MVFGGNEISSVLFVGFDKMVISVRIFVGVGGISLFFNLVYFKLF